MAVTRKVRCLLCAVQNPAYRPAGVIRGARRETAGRPTNFGAPLTMGRRVYSCGRKVDGMGLNIKSEETHQLVRELAERTGETMTAAVTAAVRERLERVRRQQGESLADRLMAIGRDCAPRLKEPFRSADHADLLYDERGLPR